MTKQPKKRPTVPVRTVQPVQGANYLRKAQQHLAIALQARANGRWDSAVLLSVHAAIAASDAVCVGKHGVRSVSKAHADQVKLVRQLFPDSEQASRAAGQLAALIDRKNTVEYEARLCTEEDAETSTKQADRVVEWARGVLSA